MRMQVNAEIYAIALFSGLIVLACVKVALVYVLRVDGAAAVAAV